MAGLGEKVLKSPKIAAAVEAKAAKVQEFWQGIAPVFGDKPAHRGRPSVGAAGDYKKSITVVPMDDLDGAPRFRVKATDWKAKWIEFGK